MAQTTDMDTLAALAAEIAGRFATLPQVEAIAMAGSGVSPAHDVASDIDLYVYWSSPIPVGERARLIRPRVERLELDNRYWELGDEWVERASGVRIDVTYRQTRWIEEQLQRVIERHEAQLGYTTSLWYNVLTSHLLFDRNAWFDRLRFLAKKPYPDGLARAIVAKNHPVLRSTLSSYLHQIELAIDRQDAVSVNHRVTAFLASYFDILFAINRLPHPGEKRLLDLAEAQCRLLPHRMRNDITDLLGALSFLTPAIIACANAVADGLDEILVREGWLARG
jgi:hypothetical protein